MGFPDGRKFGLKPGSKKLGKTPDKKPGKTPDEMLGGKTPDETLGGKTPDKKPDKRVVALVALLLVALIAGAAFLMSQGDGEGEGQGQGQDGNAPTGVAAQGSPAESDEGELEGYIAHGTEYGKSETVKVATDLFGKVTALSVEEWIKNPGEKETIKDVSSLDNITVDEDLEGVTFEQDGKSLVWKTGGQDVVYTGTTSKSLPFAIEYSYKLDGKKVDPSELEDASGKLEVTLRYENKTEGTVKYKGCDYDVKTPFVMASLLAFDPEHAINVEVDNGTVLDLNGNVLAVGIGMPGLGDVLDLGDTLELPESVTVTADVKGFDMPSITTMVTDGAAGVLAGDTGDLENQIGEAFDSLSSLEKGLGKLASANKGLSKGLGKISSGADAMAENLPNATAGLGKFAAAADGLSSLAGQAKDDAAAAVSDSDAALGAIDALLDPESEGYGNLSESQLSALRAIRDDVSGAKSSAAAAEGKLGSNESNICDGAKNLSSGLTSVSEGFEQVVTGAQGLSKALGKVKTASSALAKGTGSLSEGVSEMLSSVKSTVYGKIDILNAMAKYAQEQGAFCGSSSKMDATTTYIVTAGN